MIRANEREMVAGERGEAVRRVGLLLLGLGAAAALRVALAGPAGIHSVLAGAVFAASLLLLALSGGRPVVRLSPSALLLGVAGAAVLLAGPWLLQTRGVLPPPDPHPAALFPLWAVVVVAVAVAEELVLRGALFDALEAVGGSGAALLLTSVAFAALHLPLYGAGSLPLNLVVGLFLGGLRIWTGSVAAPATAHALADLAVWWLV